MRAYGSLAGSYDRLTDDVPYEAFADFYEKLLKREGGKTALLLDLCCGTGTVTGILARRGYEMIGADASPEMLSEAQEKADAMEGCIKPIYLCQEASELDLYGTIDGALCCLDGMNYIPPEEMETVFARLHMFIEAGGVFAFDMHAPQHLRELDGQVFVDETEDVLCLWRAEFDDAENALFYGMDIFTRDGEKWDRSEEEHIEYAHSPEELCSMLRKSGFKTAEIIRDCPMSGNGRLFIRAVNGEGGQHG